MDKIPYFVFLSIFFVRYLGADVKGLGRALVLLPEILSLVTLLFIGFSARRLVFRTRYLLLFLFFLLHVVAGILINVVSPGPIIAGIRLYFKYLPLFFLPAVFEFSPSQIRNQLRLLLILAVIQCPVTLFQRFFQFGVTYSGDVITGTLGPHASGLLSMFLAGTISMLVAFYLDKRMAGKTFLLLLLLLFIPIAINETKISLFLLPLAVIIPSYYSTMKKSHRRALIPVAVVGVLMFIGFVSIYGYFVKQRTGPGILDFFSSKQMMTKYFYKAYEVDEKDLGPANVGALTLRPRGERPEADIRRMDRLIVSLRILSNDPIKLVTGFGIGNVSESSVKGFVGEYTYYGYSGHGYTLLAHLLLELGIIGVLLFGLFFYFVLADARSLAARDDFSGTVARGWAAAPVFLLLCLAYNDYIVSEVIGYIFFFFSGYIASTRARMSAITLPSRSASGGVSTWSPTSPPPIKF